MVALTNFFQSNKHQVSLSAAFLLSIVLGAWLYWPGISGDFLLDDYENLHRLEQISGVAPFHEILNFISTGLSSKLGRPVSLLSFAAQYYEFPHPWAFKYVNVLIHLINGCLIFWVLLLVTRLSGLFDGKAHWLALAVTAIWLIHPLQISTVHYVIQRMTELSALFTLAGLCMYLTGRVRLVDGKILEGYLWASLGIALGGCLAVLSKENGILLPLYVLVVEFTLLKDLQTPRYWNLWRGVFLLLPLLLLVAYLGVHFKGLVINGYGHRDFTLTERLLTETRILFDYLLKIFIPLPEKLGLYHDNFLVSQSLFKPLSTFFTSVLLTLLVAAAFYFRKRLPVFSFGLLWFFSGHLLESTVIPLELYFEHRNYLPILGILLSTAHYAAGLPRHIQTKSIKRSALVIAGLYALTVLMISYNENHLWGNAYRQAVTWAAENPKSRRAQDALGAVLTATQQYQQAALVYKKMSQTFPRDSAPYVVGLSLTCLDPTVQSPTMDTVVEHLRNSPLQLAAMSGINRIVEAKESGLCNAIKYQDLVRIIETMMQNPSYKNHTMYFHLYLGRVYASEHLLAPAMMEYDKAFAMSHKPNVALQQVQWLFSAGLYQDALRYLAKAEQASQRNPALHVSLNPVFEKWRSILLRSKEPNNS